MTRRRRNTTRPTSDDGTALTDSEIEARIERAAAERQGVIQGQAAEVIDTLNASRGATESAGDAQEDFERPPDQPVTEEAAMAAEYDEEYADDEEDVELQSRSVFSTSMGVIENPPALSDDGGLPEITGEGSVDQRIAKLEEANAKLAKQLTDLPLQMRAMLQGLQQGQPTGGAPVAAGGNNGGGGGLLSMLPQLMAFGKQLGVFGSDQPKPQNAMANQFMEQMAQYLQIQQAMEQLQMAKMNNQTIWLARMARMFGKEGFAKLLSQGEDDNLKTGFEAMVLPGQQQQSGETKGDESE
jgi:hypothetical protein